MQKFGTLLACGALLFMSVAWVEGQQEKKQPGGGFGGFGGFGVGQNNPFALLTRGDVKKEIDVTDEQIEKLPEEEMAVISKILSEKQFKRFKQLYLQKKENNAFKDTTVQKELKMTDEQKKNVASILADEAKEIADLAPKAGAGGKGKGKGGFGGGGFGADPEKVKSIHKDSKEKIYTVLTKDQRKSWREMIGEEFTFTAPAFGGFGGGGGFGKGKDAKDAKDAKKDPPKDK